MGRVEQALAFVALMAISLGGVFGLLMQTAQSQDAQTGLTSLVAAALGTVGAGGILAYAARRWIDNWATTQATNREDDKRREDRFQAVMEQRHLDNKETIAALRADFTAREQRMRDDCQAQIGYLREVIKQERDRAGACEVQLRDTRMPPRPE